MYLKHFPDFRDELSLKSLLNGLMCRGPTMRVHRG